MLLVDHLPMIWIEGPRCAFFSYRMFYGVPLFIDAEIKTFTMTTIRIALSLSVLLLQVGCGSESGIPTAPVSGIVTREGKPLPGVEVFFSTDKFEGYGKTNESGRYELVNGAAIGTNKVFMKKFNPGGSGAGGVDLSIPGMDAGQMEAMQAAQKMGNGKAADPSEIPPEYNDPRTTKLTFPVPDGGSQSADFRL
jgi:hypothetical protein